MYRFLKIQNFCESDDNHNEKQMDEYEDVQENIKITKWKSQECSERQFTAYLSMQ